MADAQKPKDAFEPEVKDHEWDGIQEFNNPLPRWWLWTWYATIVWAIGYWIVMPAWPLVSDFSRGVLGYSQRERVATVLAEAAADKAQYTDRIRDGSLDEIAGDQELMAFVASGGRSAFAVHCSQCHGTGAAGSVGYPNLNDDDWLWGGTPEAILATIRYGIRSGHDEGREGEMLAFVRDGILTGEEAGDVAHYVVSLTGAAESPEAAGRGETVFNDWCVACHGEGGVGNPDLGAPNLADAIWLYGGTYEDIVAAVSDGRSGVMPAWENRLDAETLKQLALFIHARGGGE